jgi:hypothetical protein
MFHTKHELPERIKRLLFGKNGRYPMDTVSPKCPFCPAANHPFCLNGEKGHSSNREGNVSYPDLLIRKSTGFKLTEITSQSELSYFLDGSKNRFNSLKKVDRLLHIYNLHYKLLNKVNRLSQSVSCDHWRF